MGLFDLPAKTWTTPGNSFGGSDSVSLPMPNVFKSDYTKQHNNNIESVYSTIFSFTHVSYICNFANAFNRARFALHTNRIESHSMK